MRDLGKLDNYSIFYRSPVSIQELSASSYSLYVSAYNPSDRVVGVHSAISARRKVWVVHNEYGFNVSELSKVRRDGCFESSADADEAQFCAELARYLELDKVVERGERVCIDLTGFMRPHMMHLVLLLRRMGLQRFDSIYSEPVSYAQREQTEFSRGGIRETRQVRGFEGFATPDSSSDVLVIGAGYDDRLISEVAQFKDSARKVMVVGFPSLRADMYQQNLLRIALSKEALGDVPRRWTYFAPANDPFATASALASIASVHMGESQDGNFYLSPLATKAQALGFALFFAFEGTNRNASIIFPFSNAYQRETGIGLARTWRYVVEFPQEINS